MVVARTSKLRLKESQLQIEDDQGMHHVPLEDVAILVLESAQISLSSALLAACAENNTVVVIGDRKFLPCGALLPLWSHSRHYEMLKLQIGSSLPLRKRIWQLIVKAKIDNQSFLLAEKDPEFSRRLVVLSGAVKSGDTSNLEAQASRIYWRKLLGEKFTRDGSDRRNFLLNFGYSLIRSALARSVVAHGLSPALGVHHKSELNAFNLVDDLFEPFRVYVDSLVIKMPFETSELLLKCEKIELYKLLNSRFFIGDERQQLVAACDLVVESFINALRQKDPRRLLLPRYCYG